MSPLIRLILLTLMSVLAGRGLEMMVGVARISDLTVFWVILGIFAALPVVAMDPQTSSQPVRRPARRLGPNVPSALSFPRNGVSGRRWLLKLAIVT